MKASRKISKRLMLLAVITLAIAGSPTFGNLIGLAATMSVNPPPFDFSDDFYRANGLVPGNIVLRVGTASRSTRDWVVDNSNTDPNRRNIRILETIPGTDGSGNLTYANITGVLNSTSFERNANGSLTARGQSAVALAERFRVFIFPKASAGSILDPFLPNKRQDNVFDTRDGYFSNNPLGMWVAAFVVYTPKAFTEEGYKKLDPIAATNGRDLDGTPILTSASLIDNLVQEGLVELRTRPIDDPVFRWVICPIPTDHRNGFIAPDAFVGTVKNPDGSELFPRLRQNFICLQQTGDWCN